MNLTRWDNGSRYQSASGQFSDHICGPENTGIFSLVEKNISSLGDGNLNKRKREFDNHFRNDLIVSLPMSKDPNYWNAGGSGVREGLIHEVESSFPISMEHLKQHEHFTPVRTNYDIRAFYFTSGDHIPQKLDVSVASRGIINREENNLQQLDQGYENGEGAATSAMGSQNRPKGTNHSGYLIPNCDLLLSPSLPDGSEVLTEKSANERSAYQTVTVSQTNTITVDNVPKKVEKEAKKNFPNSFPSNVKSLMSTGILDGVPVKYVSWSREKSLRGIIKGTGYLCGCDDCKMNKNVNAFEFERHAGCKTKHPNNHIYFVSGKTIYSVVQDLKGTQQEMLFEAIKNVTGSPINVKNYRVWKASYQAATRELQRIYGEEI
nr:Polygalacturonase non-catalytic subunit like [Ipomoea batatas]